MAVVYFDASAAVKLFVNEHDSETVVALWNGCDTATSSRLTYIEVCAALAAGERNNRLTAEARATAVRRWQTYWATMHRVELTPAVEQSAGALTAEYQLRGADALHLASALAVDSSDLVVATWDKRLHLVAQSTGLATAPAEL